MQELEKNPNSRLKHPKTPKQPIQIFNLHQGINWPVKHEQFVINITQEESKYIKHPKLNQILIL